MKLGQLLQSLLLAGSVVVLITTPTKSEEVKVSAQRLLRVAVAGANSRSPLPLVTTTQPLPATKKIPHLSEVERPFTSIHKLVQADVQAAIAVTGVKIAPTDDGLDAILETTAGKKLQVLPQKNVQGQANTYIADIPNAQLRLPSGNTFRQQNPAPGIADLVVTNLDANTIRVTVTGKTNVPKVELFDSNEGLILAIASSTADANAPTEESKEVVVSATRTEEEVQNVPRAVTVITREQIEQQTKLTTDLVEIIGRLTPGAGPPTGIVRNSGQAIRGRAPQVLIDGVPVTSNDSTTGFDRDLQAISPEAIERVEVVRGPSAVYGDGAAGGVINLITRQPQDRPLTSITRIGVDATGGLEEDSFGTSLSHSISFSEGNADGLALFSLDSTGIAYDAEGDPIPFGEEGTAETETLQALGKVGVNLDANQRLQLTANVNYDNYDFSLVSDPSVDELPIGTKARALRVSPEYIGFDDPETLNTAVSLNYSHDNLFGGSKLNAQAYYRYTKIVAAFFDDRLLDDSLGITSRDQKDDRWGGRLQVETPLFNDAASLLWGADYSVANASSELAIFDPDEFDNSGGRTLRAIEERTFFPSHRIENLGLFAQLQADVSEQLQLSGGVRYENISVDVPSFTNSLLEDIGGGERSIDDVVFNAGVVFKATDQLSLYANFAQGFSIPSIANILFDAPAGFQFDRDVNISDPQKVDNYEIGVKGEWGNVQASLAAFYNESDLGTSFVREDPADIELTLVRAPQRNYGVEAAIDWELEQDWQLGGSVTWLEGESNLPDDDEGFQAISSRDASPIKLTAYVQNETTPGWNNRLQALFVGSRDRGFESGADPVAIDSYFVLDYISSIAIGAGTLEIGIENLLDNQYATVAGQWNGGFLNSFNFPARGRTIRFGYRINW